MTMSKRLLAAALALVMLLCWVGALADTVPHNRHKYREWVSYRPFYHSSHCEIPGCTRWAMVPCTRATVELTNGNSLRYCPICGTLENEETVIPSLTMYESDIRIIHNPSHKWLGRPLVRMGTLSDGTVLLSFAYETFGSARRNTCEIAFSVPAELLQGRELIAIAGCGQTGLSVEIHGDTADITLPLIGSPAAMLVFGLPQ